jgi:hypothetical protein
MKEKYDMVHGEGFMVHGSMLKAHGEWLTIE